MVQTRQIGTAGESLAETFLQSQGHRILERNWCCRFGELDLITQKDKGLFFVEVKTRHSDRYGSPLLAVGPRKQAKIRRVAELYLAKHQTRFSSATIYLSCLGISFENGQPSFDWLPQAFGF